jgi:preprotein translocase subunit SecA
MAGRGTDIMLGGNAEMMAKTAVGNDDSPEYLEMVQKLKGQVEAERAEVRAAGGLCIIGTERHESRRIDNQLRGRSGRQGDPGESKFYLSLEDKLMRIFNGERIQKIMEMLNIPEDEPITAKMVTNAIEGAQRKVEGHNFDIRKNLMEYDSVMNSQRNAIYSMRRKVLEGQEIERTTLDWLGDVVSNLLDTYIPENGKKEEWSIDGLNNSLSQTFGFKIDMAGKPVNVETVTDAVKGGVRDVLARQKSSMGQFFEQVQKMILLQSIDNHWKSHLYIIDKLKEGIGLRGYAQKDPLIEYKKEAFKAFETLNETIKKDAIEKIMRVQLVAQQSEEQVLESLRPEGTDLDELDYSSPSEAQIGHSIPESSGGSEPEKRRMTFQSGPRDDRPMNREERRRQEKPGKGKR